MGKQIVFTGKSAWDAGKESMAFQVEIDGRKTRCLVTREALEDHFGADRGKTVEQAFNDNVSAIESAAKKIINKDQVNQDGEYLIKSRDI